MDPIWTAQRRTLYPHWTHVAANGQTHTACSYSFAEWIGGGDDDDSGGGSGSGGKVLPGLLCPMEITKLHAFSKFDIVWMHAANVWTKS